MRRPKRIAKRSPIAFCIPAATRIAHRTHTHTRARLHTRVRYKLNYKFELKCASTMLRYANAGCSRTQTQFAVVFIH